MKRLLVLSAIGTVFVAMLVYAFGPMVVAPQSDLASTICNERYEMSEVRWKVFPVAGWRCVIEDEEHYLGWWATGDKTSEE